MKKHILLLFLSFAGIFAFGQEPKVRMVGDSFEISFEGQEKVDFQISQRDFVSGEMVAIKVGTLAEGIAGREILIQMDPNGEYLLRYNVHAAGTEEDLWMEIDPLSLIGKDHN